MSVLLVGAFGVLGVYLRYALNQLIPLSLGSQFPFATLIINIAGSFIIGMVYAAAAAKYSLTDSLRIPLMTGFLGGFTTFSAFSLDAILLANSGRHFYSLLYILGNVGGGLLATGLGIALVSNQRL